MSNCINLRTYQEDKKMWDRMPRGDKNIDPNWIKQDDCLTDSLINLSDIQSSIDDIIYQMHRYESERQKYIGSAIDIVNLLGPYIHLLPKHVSNRIKSLSNEIGNGFANKLIANDDIKR